jgi:hypothetical protein
MIVQAQTPAWNHQARFGGRVSRVGTGHIRYWLPNEAVVASRAHGTADARSSGWPRRHHHTAATTAASVTSVPTVPITADAGLYQCRW